MKDTFIIAIRNGQVVLQGPLDDVPACLRLIAEGMAALAVRAKEQSAKEQAAAPPRPQLFLGDGSIAPLSTSN